MIGGGKYEKEAVSLLKQTKDGPVVSKREPFDESLPRHHLNCTYILPSPARTKFRKNPKTPRCYRERTHGCWCSSWRLLKNGEYRVWRRGAWRKPKPGEVRRSRRAPR